VQKERSVKVGGSGMGQKPQQRNRNGPREDAFDSALKTPTIHHKKATVDMPPGDPSGKGNRKLCTKSQKKAEEVKGQRHEILDKTQGCWMSKRVEK